MTKKLINQGAEAKIFLYKNIIYKQRIKKSYRHPIIDEQIRVRRTRHEAKLLKKAYESKINVPKILMSDKFNLEIEFLKGDKLSDTLNKYDDEKQFKVMQNLGKETAKLHDDNIIHADLTTSNVILKEDKVFIIDFGLGFISNKIEDKAVDLHLIKQALIAKHFQNQERLFKNFLKGYRPKELNKILERLSAVEKRGRYRH